MNKMIIYEISVNGEKLCEIGVNEEDQLEVALAKLVGDDGGVLNITALLPCSPQRKKSLEWETYYLQVGDEITVKTREATARQATYLDDYREPDEEDESESTIFCSFCGKGNLEVEKIVAGNDAFICEECIQLCTDILDSEKP